MSISVNPTVPVITAQGTVQDTAFGAALQPGTVVSAQVLKILADDLVQISVASLSMEVLTEIPLQVGQRLMLAVSPTQDGIRLAVVGPAMATASGSTNAETTIPAPGTASASSKANAGAVANVSVNAAVSLDALTRPERSAVSAAIETAAARQGSLAPLFANLGVVASSGDLPPALQQAVAQVLAQRSSIDQGLTGGDIKDAFERSGLFLEASLASGSASTASGLLDLKAALIVLRQTLLSSLGTEAGLVTAPGSAPQPAVPAAPDVAPADDILLPHVATATASLAASLPAEVAASEIIAPQLAPSMASPGAAARVAETAAVLNLLQEILPETALGTGGVSPASAIPQEGRDDIVTVHTSTPPPPFRGALPSAQPVAPPTIVAGAPLAVNARHLVGDTDAAIARQTLLQVASLPVGGERALSLADPSAPLWNFEVPFVTQQGTAVAQFEISRDGAGSEAEAARRTWRARFSLDIEPAGPVHAMVSLVGDRTSVRMWAERPATAERLQAGVSQLGQALIRAELLPGDIKVRVGAPAQSALAPAGHFLDRAL